jgi:hypothetical protein
LQSGYKRPDKQRQKDGVCNATGPNAGFYGSLFKDQIIDRQTHKITQAVHNQVSGGKTAKQRKELEYLNSQRKTNTKCKITNDASLFKKIIQENTKGCKYDAVGNKLKALHGVVLTRIERHNIPQKAFT